MMHTPFLGSASVIAVVIINPSVLLGRLPSPVSYRGNHKYSVFTADPHTGFSQVTVYVTTPVQCWAGVVDAGPTLRLSRACVLFVVMLQATLSRHPNHLVAM